MPGLGEDFDLSIGVAPSDIHVGAVTGKRVFMGGIDSADVVIIKAAGTAGDDPTVTLQAAAVASGGSPASLVVISSYHLKDATALAGTEKWVKLTQTTAATIADPGGAGTSAEHQQLCVIHVNATDMPAGKPYLGVNIAAVTGAAEVAAVLYILHAQTKSVPASLPAPLR